jgi:rod shape-determining protein MreB
LQLLLAAYTFHLNGVSRTLTLKNRNDTKADRKPFRVAGDKMDFSIIQYIRRNYNLLIGERTAEIIKTTIGNASPDPQSPETIEVKGRDLTKGIPKILSINSEEIRVAISEQIEAIVQTVKTVLEQTPPELAADIVDSGIVLTGGGALLKNLDKLLSEEVGLPITITEDPLSTIALGAGKALDNIEILKQVMIK